MYTGPRKLVYWCAPHLTDRAVYNVRGPSKKAVEEKIKELGVELYGKPQKVVIEYHSILELADRCLSGEVREPDPDE